MVKPHHQWSVMSSQSLHWLILRIAFCLLLSACCLLPAVLAAPLTCVVSEIAPQNRSLRVMCLTNLPGGRYRLKFMEKFAGIERLSERVYSLRIRDAGGRQLQPEIHGSGIYSLNLNEPEQVIAISYEMRLGRALDPGEYPLTSSLGPEAGFLLLDDLLPRLCLTTESDDDAKPEPVRLKINLPAGWQAATTEQLRGDFFEVRDQSRAVFFLGRLRQQTLDINGVQLRIAITGEWSFSDGQAARLAAGIASEQAALMGELKTDDNEEPLLVTLAPYPIPLTGLRSSALTRHRTVVMMLNQNGNPARTFAHYSRHLAHEMFHYYLPGAFNISENFDWFWEGFTRYVALVTLQRLKTYTLREYLDALGEEYESYIYNPARNRLSLLVASPDKFANLANYELVYRKGMLVAGLYDLELRWQSDGKRNLMEMMRRLYQRHALTGRETGNREIIAELQKAGDFARFIRDNIEGTREIDLVATLKPYGLTVERNPSGRPRITVAPKLSARQRALMAQLGN
jgi:predicted metalloprotease with PDZ domain